MPADVVLVMDGDAKNSVREFEKLRLKTVELEQRLKSVKNEGRDFDGVLGKVGGRVAAFAASFLTLGTAAAVLSKIEGHLERVAQRNNEASKSLVSLAAMYAGQSGAFDRQMVMAGAKSGLRPAEAAQLGVTIPTNIGATIKDYEVGARLTKLGVSPEKAGDVVVAGVSRGVGAERAADLTVAASGESKLTTDQMSRAIAATAQYSRMEEGLAAAAAISLTGVNAERIPELVKASGKALSDDTSKFAKKFKLKGLTESDKVQRLRALAEASGDVGKFASIPSLTKYGLGEQEAESVGMLIRNAGAFEGTEQKLTAEKPGSMAAKIEAIGRTRPEIAGAWESAAAAAQFEANQLYGPTGAAARNLEAQQQAAGLRIQRDQRLGGGLMVDESGKANWLGRASESIRRGQEVAGYGTFVGGVPLGNAPTGPMTVPGAEERRRQETAAMGEATAKDLTTALRENTAATQANTDATGGGGDVAPVPAGGGGG